MYGNKDGQFLSYSTTAHTDFHYYMAILAKETYEIS